MISTKIEIAVSPAVVRAKLMDFSQLPVYSPNGFMKQIKPENLDKQIEKGDKLNCVIAGMQRECVVLENSQEAFGWQAGTQHVLQAKHYFRFQPSTTNPGGTTFVHQEMFSGALAFILREGWAGRLIGMRAKIEGWFKNFDIDLKKVCEA
ncbi:hypothetical protein F5884DRAFT_678085 [Xylogone sp. PMI_703]|nr:hypothetical protein F5884DRAFT_678085 [Xylogone sp. PMI_703]